MLRTLGEMTEVGAYEDAMGYSEGIMEGFSSRHRYI